MSARRAFAPGRVNLIGDHTDYAGGRSLAICIGLGTTATFDPDHRGPARATSHTTGETVPLTPTAGVTPGSFAAMVQSMAEALGVGHGSLVVESTLPMGAGLSSSASLLMATALSMGASGSTLDLALRCQAAEAAAGQSVGLLDQLTIAAGQRGSGVAIDFQGPSWRSVRLDHRAAFLVVHSGQERRLASGAYGERRRECEAATAIVGPLGTARLEDLGAIADPVVHKRALHVITESARVDAFARAMAEGDLAGAGRLMLESHRSLAEDFDVSTLALDSLVASISSRPGVVGARLTGAGFGGCVIALMERGALSPESFERAWLVEATDGARLIDIDSGEASVQHDLGSLEA